MTGPLRQTSLHDWHAAHGGRMVDFAGWSMPVQYESITSEHKATREAVGLFDVSHMGRLEFAGEDVAAQLDRLVTRRVSDLKPGRIRYALVCNTAGGILDDVLVYRLAEEAGVPFQIVVNAGNRDKLVAWFAQQLAGTGVTMTDQTLETAMIAVQGPRALQTVQTLCDLSLNEMRYYTAQRAIIAGESMLVSRTGYTGEDGCELILPAAAAPTLWEAILAAGEAAGAQAVGLGARDTLRLEAAMPLYGHELSESINPLEAGLAFAVNLRDRQFIGRDALAKIAESGSHRARIGLTLEGRRIPREGYAVLDGDTPIGEVTSGTFSPTFDKPIAMALVQSDRAQSSQLAIDIRGQILPATAVPLPFYKR